MPHSKVTATLIISLAVITSTVIYAKKDYFFGPKTTAQAQVVVETPHQINTPADTDWQKMLTSSVGTDQSPVQIITPDSTSTTDDNSLTAQISKQFFSLYLQDKKNGVTIDQNEAFAIADQALNNVQTTSSAVQYTLKDVKITNDSSDTSMGVYEQGLLQAMNSNFKTSGPDVMTIVNQAIESGKDSDLAKLDPIIKSYQSAIHSILQVTVPSKAIGYHMVYLNTMSSLLYDLQGLRQVLTDPLMSYVAFTNFQKDTVKLNVVITSMNQAFAQQ